jgi:hypothetical protein
MIVLEGETLERWDRRVRREMRAHDVGVDDVFLPFWYETTRRSILVTWNEYEREKQAPMFLEAIVYVTHILWEPHLTDEQWAARLAEEGWDTDISAWEAAWMANLRQWQWATDAHGQPRRYLPADRAYPGGGCYVTTCNWLLGGRPAEITYARARATGW